MAETDPDKVYVAFDSPQTAVRMTGGTAHAVKGVRDDENAFILTDQKGRSFVYVRAEYSGYRGVANRAAGEPISKKGEDADHAGSRTVNKDKYVLLARVPKSANRSAGSVEKVTTLDGQFNRASTAPAPGGGYALPMSARNAEKLSGKIRAEYQTRDANYHAPLKDENIAVALLQAEDDQARLREMKGDLIVQQQDLAKDGPKRYAEPDAMGIKGPWDRMAADKANTTRASGKEVGVATAKKR
ncbi:hypothetical protein [Roseobacter sp. S98]|uniref:hypothetical protein n=1 Tax=Roseobacter algicola (ex Choi et al. 2025) (nom. illeg.) TaxID=3092138 RepID=UPI0035C73CF1